jgi:hypothetical protein
MQDQFDDRPFAALDEAEQDAILERLDAASSSSTESGQDLLDLSWKTPSRASSPTRSTAATAAWSPGTKSAFPAPATTTAFFSHEAAR